MNHFRLEVKVTVPRKLKETKISAFMILLASVMAEPEKMIEFDDPCYDREAAGEYVVVTTNKFGEPEKWTHFETERIVESKLSVYRYQELVREAFFRGAEKLRLPYEIKGEGQKWPPKRQCSFANTSTDLEALFKKIEKTK